MKRITEHTATVVKAFMKRPGTEKEKKMDAYPFAIQIK